MESGYEDDQGHRKVAREQNTDRKDREKNHAVTQITLISIFVFLVDR